MSEVHLKQLQNGIEKCHWNVSSETEGNDYDISGVWVIEKPDKSQRLHIEFEGLSESNVLPLNQSYACRVKEHPEISAYFSKKGKSWPEELKSFLQKLKQLKT